MPLKRDNSGRLGVSMHGGGGGQVNVRMGDTNITVQGGADSKALAAISAELDRRDRRIREGIPGLLRQQKGGRQLRGVV